MNLPGFGGHRILPQLDAEVTHTKLTNAGRALAVALVAYIVCDILLTPPAHLETRDPAKVTIVGIAAPALLFVWLALGIVALLSLLRRSGVSLRTGSLTSLSTSHQLQRSEPRLD
jgi:hypothetical protein